MPASNLTIKRRPSRLCRDRRMATGLVLPVRKKSRSPERYGLARLCILIALCAGWMFQTVIVSVLESLRQHLASFTLSSVIEEIRRWSETGRSCFACWAEKLGLIGHGLPEDGRPSLLDPMIPVPDV
jgi:hypothetical protein